MLKLSVNEANDLADEIERTGGNADGLRAAINDVGNPGNGQTSIPATTTIDEKWLEEKRSESPIERGVDLVCGICQDKFDHLISGTCEVCFRQWALSTRPKQADWRTKGIL